MPSKPHPFSRRAMLLLIAALSALPNAQAQAVPDAPAAPTREASSQTLDNRFNDALLAYERNHWLQAFDEFTLLAEQGHADAARMAMQMHRQGPRLYGQHFALTPLQQQRFAQHRLRTQALRTGQAAARPGGLQAAQGQH